ncbi:MAG TPA: fibronectin type III domain-containing protein [Terriglobia bacterium]|nr:fibronectin type III domain-containing protein [Terriglobia bacterium]
MTKPLEIEIFRAITGPGATPAEPEAGSAPWRTLSTDDLQKYTEGGKIIYSTKLSDQEFRQSLGSTFTFAVRGLTRGFRGRRLEGEYSNIVRPVLLDVSAPVGNLQIKTTEKALVLSWTPPSRSITGQTMAAPSSYQVYWSPTGKPGTFQKRGETTTSAFSDPDFAFEHTYFYRIRAIFKQGNQVAESDDPAPVAITPHDTFPPAPPSNVSALFSAGAIQLVWTANTEPDLAGYNVYRREKDGVAHKINSEMLRTPTFEDRTVQAGHQYFYRVTSVDLTHNESLPSEEVTAETP